MTASDALAGGLAGTVVGVLFGLVLERFAPSGIHGVVTETVSSPKPSARWYNTEAEARAEFDEQVMCLQDDQQGPGIVRVRLVLHGEVEAEEFIVRRISTYQ